MSERFVIRGGRPLRGEVAVSGSKNAALYTLAAGLLSADPVTIRNVPEIADIGEMADVCRALGVEIEVDGTTVHMQAREFTATAPPTELVMALRASFLVMGPVLARAGEAGCASPGGDVIGVRPLDVHLAGFRALGAEVERVGAEWVARASTLTGARIFLDYPSVLGTVNVMFAAALAEGTTTIVNAAAEPEVEMAAAMLNSMGARITGHGTAIMTIEGVERMHGTDFEVIPDRIEAGTYLLAGLATAGDLHVTNADPAALDSLLTKFHELDADVSVGDGPGVRVSCPRPLKPIQVQAVPYPGFPTDLHAPMAAALTQVPGVSTIHERVFDNRTLYVGELRNLGAKIITGGQTVIVEGGGRLSGAIVRALDIRAGAAVVIGGLAADGETEIGGIEHLDRGYAHLAARLNAVGADVSRR